MHDLLQTIRKTQSSIDTIPEARKAELVNSIVALAKTLLDQVIWLKNIPENFEQKSYPGMISQLKAGKKRTETAANDILTAAEGILEVLSGMKGKEKEAIQKHTYAILEACNFQDLVSQHLDQAEKLTEELRDDINVLRQALDGSIKSESEAIRRVKNAREDEHLMNGPKTDI